MQRNPLSTHKEQLRERRGKKSVSPWKAERAAESERAERILIQRVQLHRWLTRAQLCKISVHALRKRIFTLSLYRAVARARANAKGENIPRELAAQMRVEALLMLHQ